MPAHPDRIGIAKGDDGHWCLVESIGKFWLDDIIEAFKAMKV